MFLRSSRLTKKMVFTRSECVDTSRLKKEEHLRLHNALMNCTGKFLISYNDCPEIRELWDKTNIYIESISRMNNLGVCNNGKKEYEEYILDTKRQNVPLRDTESEQGSASLCALSGTMGNRTLPFSPARDIVTFSLQEGSLPSASSALISTCSRIRSHRTAVTDIFIPRQLPCGAAPSPHV